MLKLPSLFAAFVSLALLNVATSAPDQPDRTPKTPKEKVVPNIAGPSEWGFIEQDGRKITISGNRQWHVERGEIRKDGKLFVIWIDSNGKLAPGMYTIGADGSIIGHYNYGECTSTGEDGTWHGLNWAETLRRAKPAAPEQ